MSCSEGTCMHKCDIFSGSKQLTFHVYLISLFVCFFVFVLEGRKIPPPPPPPLLPVLLLLLPFFVCFCFSPSFFQSPVSHILSFAVSWAVEFNLNCYWIFLFQAQLHWECLRSVTSGWTEDAISNFSSKGQPLFLTCSFLHTYISFCHPCSTCTHAPLLTSNANMSFYFFHVQWWRSLRFYGP